MLRHCYHRKSLQEGFTLAELLISLAILGMIATFTIPKILLSQQNAQYNSKAKEAVSMVSGAYQNYQAQNSIVATTVGVPQLTPFMNYVAVDSSTTIDDKQGLNTYTCGSCAACQCLKLHNGGILRYGLNSPYIFGGTGVANNVWFDLDPDGIATDGTTNGPGKAIEFMIFYNGRITTRGANNGSNEDPPWFSW